VPSTNTSCQPESEQLRPIGVTNHIARISIKEKPLTSQEVANLLLQGWQAAERGEPLDMSQPWHWVQGFRLWCTAHPAKADPMAVNQ
jgi:hypothetical protein